MAPLSGVEAAIEACASRSRHTLVGKTFGKWRVVAALGRNGKQGGLRITVQCTDCGATTKRSCITDVVRGILCRRCNPPGGYNANTEAAARMRAVYKLPAIDPDLPYEKDETCQKVIEEHGELDRARIGACLGVSRERVRQLEIRALRIFVARMAAAGYHERDIVEWLVRPRSIHGLSGGERRPLERGHKQESDGYEKGSRMRGSRWVNPPEPAPEPDPQSAESILIDRALSEIEKQLSRLLEVLP